MPTLLHIDSSPRRSGSISRALSTEFVKNWWNVHPDGKTIQRDLADTPLKAIDSLWIAAAFTPEPRRTPEQNAVLALSDELIAELQEADEYAFGVPMHNFGIPGTLKLWIDQIARAGKTFTYEGGSPKGLLTGKKATFLIATGGKYGPDSAYASLNFVEPYLHSAFAFLGVSETVFVTAGGTAALNYGGDLAEFLAPHLESVRLQFAG